MNNLIVEFLKGRWKSAGRHRVQISQKKRELEKVLRENGYSKREAVHIASLAFRQDGPMK